MAETIILPSGNKLIVHETGKKFILYSNGPGFGVEIIEPNEFIKGSDEWNNKEIEDYALIKKFS